MNAADHDEYPDDMRQYLEPARFIDSSHPAIQAFTEKCLDGASGEKALIRIYYAVRDEILYDPWYVGRDERYYRASECLQAGRGFCIPKAALMAACARYAGIPARVGYADVRNHLRTPRLEEIIDGDVYVWHSYTEVFLDHQWVKATPAFNIDLCLRFDVSPLDFDGTHDSLFQEFDRRGRRHMEYVRMRDHYPDVPYESIIADFSRYHPRWLAFRDGSGRRLVGDSGS